MAVVSIPTSRNMDQMEQPIRTMSILFVANPPANAMVLRRYTDPHAQAAVQHIGEGAQLDIVTGNDTKAFRQLPRAGIDVTIESSKIGFQPGRASILGSVADIELLMPAVIDFAFYEEQLRNLEQAISPLQATADADVAVAYQIRGSDRSQWDRLYQTMQDLYRLRLMFARLEPHLVSADRSMPIDARRLFNRLLVKSGMEDRLEALSDRLEALEDLYEGAVDRITDYRNYRKGVLLEVGIVVLLLLEVILLLVQAFHGR